MINKNFLYFKIFYIIVLFLFPASFVFAESISYNGCAEISSEDNNITVRMKSMEASININDANGETYYFTINNLDPDFFIISNYNEGTLTRSANSLNFQITVADDVVITISPWYEPDNLYFISFGDPQITANDDFSPNGNFGEILDQIDIINPFFSTCSGDLISGDGADQDEHTAMYDQYIEMTSQIKSSLFTVPGNHDWRDGLDDYNNYFGDYNYSFDYLNNHFTFTSSVNDRYQGYWSNESLDWLGGDLASSNLENKFVFFHHALVPPDWYLQDTFDDEENRNTVAEILDNNNTDFLIVGHNHGYDYQFLDNSKISTINNGFYQLISGGAGGELADDQYYHFNLFNIEDQTINQQMVRKNSFYLDVEELDENDGTEEEVSYNVINYDEDNSWPWLRLKYKLNSDIDNFYAYDEEGNYLETNTQLLDNYRVVYLETSLEAGADKTFTVAKNTKIHEGVTNTVYNNGEVAYSSMPENSNTETSLQASVSNDYSKIKINDWQTGGNYYSKWIETASKKKSDTTYSISDLESGYRYKLTVNDNLYGYYYPDSDGVIEFTYTNNKKKRIFELEKTQDFWPTNITMMPASGGGPLLRVMNENSEAVSQFYAYKSSWNGGFKAIKADLNGNHSQEIITIPEKGFKTQLRVFNTDGDLLAKINPFKSSYKKGGIIKAGDIDNDGKDEIIVASQKGSKGNVVKIYDYQPKKKRLKLKKVKRIYDESFKSGINIEVANVDNTSKEEIIVTPDTGTGELKVLQYKKGKLKILASKNVYENYDYSGIDVAVGDVNKKGRNEIITVPKEGGENLIKVFRLTKNNNLKFVRKKKAFKEDVAGGLSVVAGDFTGDFKDEVIIAPERDQTYFKVYKFDKYNKLKLVDKKEPYGSDFTEGFNTALVDFDGDWDLELVVTPKNGAYKTMIYDYQKGEVELNNSFWGYSNDFAGGINIVNNL